MNKGIIEQVGTPIEIFDKPATPFVAEFVGENNFIESEIVEPGIVRWGLVSFHVNGYPLKQRLKIYFRPNDVLVSSRNDIESTKTIIAKTKFKGAIIELQLLIEPGKKVIAHIPKGVYISRGYHDGAEVYIRITEYHSFLSDKRVIDESIVSI